ncbi:MAG: cation-translocating P-type ATPase [Prevotellaceae bacterium]|nr:cation-translocating P-type ATPase [Prevotellaceae bacterium]
MLDESQILASRAEHGANILTPPEKEPLWKQFLQTLTGPFGHLIPGWENGDSLVFILEIAALLSTFISCSEYFGWLGLSASYDAKLFFEPAGIIAAIVLATGISFYFEVKANREFDLLNQVNDDEPVKAIRIINGEQKVVAVPRKDIVVGDTLMLSTGEEVPADCELLEATSLSIDESTLTGEPICHKTTNESEFDANATFPSNRIMRGTKVMEGHCVCRVFAVGDKTENGKVFTAAQITDNIKTPLDEQFDRLGMVISMASYVVGILVFVGRIVTFVHGHDDAFSDPQFLPFALQSLMIAVTLVVCAVPEGLPMAVSLSLALSMRRMLKTNNLVRKMHACETMGATTVICTDKTGTLTQNKMQVAEVFPEMSFEEPLCVSGWHILEDTQSSTFLPIREGGGRGRDMILNMAINSTAIIGVDSEGKETILGNPTEGALIFYLRDNGIDYAELRSSSDILEEVPFSTERKYMSTTIASPSCVSGWHILEDTQSSTSLPTWEGGRRGRMCLIKGAPEIVMEMCDSFAAPREEIEAKLLDYQSKGMRTLGFAVSKDVDGSSCVSGSLSTGEGGGRGHSFFLGIVAISDPVRPDVPAAIEECIRAGIRINIVTGDTPATAKEIARQIGLVDPTIITGPEFAALSDEEVKNYCYQTRSCVSGSLSMGEGGGRGHSLIISRARPMDKKRLVETLQSLGDVVAVTGDGTNDAPALKAAHVGLSMGDGTSVAKEASDITIIDNSFSSIGRAVMWGRSLYQNIQRFILFQLTVNVAACLIVLAGAFMGTESPLTVTQMLWVNLIMDTFAAMALASLPPSESVMRDAPRDRKSFIISKKMVLSIFLSGGFMFAVLFAYLQIGMPELSGLFCVSGSLPTGEGGGRGSIFTIFVMFQFWNLFNARAFSTGRSAFHLKGCKGFVGIAAAIFFGQIIIMNLVPDFFNVTPISFSDWLVVIAGTSIVLVVGEILRLFRS